MQCSKVPWAAMARSLDVMQCSQVPWAVMARSLDETDVLLLLAVCAPTIPSSEHRQAATAPESLACKRQKVRK